MRTTDAESLSLTYIFEELNENGRCKALFFLVAGYQASLSEHSANSS